MQRLVRIFGASSVHIKIIDFVFHKFSLFTQLTSLALELLLTARMKCKRIILVKSFKTIRILEEPCWTRPNTCLVRHPVVPG